MEKIRRFAKTIVDVFKIYWQIAPALTIGILTTNIIKNLHAIVNAYIFGWILDRLIGFVNRGLVDINEIVSLIIIYSSISLFFSLNDLLNSYFDTLLGSQDSFRLRLKQADFLCKLEIAQLEEPELTNMSTRYTEVYSSLRGHLTSSVSLISNFVSSLISGAILIKYQPVVVLPFIALFIIKFQNNSKFRRTIWKKFKETTEERRVAWTSIGYLTSPNSIKELKITKGFDLLRKKFTSFQEWYYSDYKKTRSEWFSFEVLHVILDSMLFGFGIFQIIKKSLYLEISVGSITFYIRTLASFSGQIDTLSYKISRVAEEGMRIQDALDLFDTYKPLIDGTSKLVNNNRPPEINLKNISFSYPNSTKPVISELSLNIKPGEKLAIVGENGAGKTTLIKIITRVYKVSSGNVFINGKNVETLKTSDWYKRIGILFQDFNAYESLSVAENVHIGRRGRKTRSRHKIIEALHKADALGFVSAYPNGVAQILSERFKGGIRPSGGQWQKLAIARMFYRNAPVLILDEPTASIDAISEAKIFRNVYKFMKGKTVIIISHRFSTVRAADRIIVLSHGKIIEEGNHETLMKLNGVYRAAFNLQAKGYS